MKRTIFTFASIFLVSIVFAQQIPTLKTGKSSLGLYSLDIKVDVIGNRATTTYDMLFYNPKSTVQEGELSFPLGEGHEVSRFALAINGKLREAVVVEKELGRIAFEAVVRRRVDPALLEKGTGNNYKARIYPIPAKGYKRIVLAYEQELTFDIGAHFYNLPLNFKNSLHEFKLQINVFDQKSKPVVTKGRISGLDFKSWNKNYTTKVQKTNYIANTPLRIKIPLPVYTEKIVRFEDLFYIYKTLEVNSRTRTNPEKITLFWDVSLSMKDRDLQKEFALLTAYFKKINTVRIEVFSFSNTIIAQKQFSIRNGNWSGLKKHLEESVYDGGTSYENLIGKSNNSDLSLLFTDGLSTLSTLKLQSKNPLFIVNSLSKSNHAALKVKAEASKGTYINIQTRSTEKALLQLLEEPYRFLGFTSSDPNIELFPKAPTTVLNDFSIVGNGLKENAQIELHFGYGSEVSKKIRVQINKDAEVSKGAQRIWAQKKLAFLAINPKKNKRAIIDLSKTHSLVSDYTSLIVLDDIRDYIRYQITPPEELLPEYNRILAQQKEDKKNSSKVLAFISNDSALDSDQRMRRTSNNSAQEYSTTRRIVPTALDDTDVEEMVVEQISAPDMVVESEIVTNADEYIESDEDIPFSIIEEPPVFPGCTGSREDKKRCFTAKIEKHVKEHFNIDLVNGLGLSSGRHRIYGQFTINRRGNVTIIGVRARHRSIEAEVKRVLRLLPRMQPGKQRNRPVVVRYVLPITLNIEDTGASIASVEAPISTSQQEVPSYKKYQGDLTVKKRVLNTPYLEALSKTRSVNEGYALYLKQREKFKKTPAYFVDVAQYFSVHFKSKKLSNRILSNIPEVDFDDYELLKVFAYQLAIDKQLDLAVFVNQRILELRPEDAQSYRDLALAYEAAGKCQEAFDVFNDILSGKIYEDNERRVFKSIEYIAKNEVKHLIGKYRDDLDLSKVDASLLEDEGYDIRVLVDWNHNDTDIDLHIIDPNLEECSYKHRTTGIQGSMSEDMTQGFGPEEFTLRKAIKGDYYVKIKYYGDRYQKVENPTFMKVTICKNYGKTNEERDIKLIRLTKKDDKEMIAKIRF